MAESLITVIVPTRERVDLLRTTLHSILASSAEAERHGISARVLVVDDASPTDRTAKLASDLGADYVRIDVNDGRNNPAAAIVYGVSLVTTRYYTLLGDDDLLLPRYVRLTVEALEAGYDLCSTSFSYVDEDLRITGDRVLPPPDLEKLLAGQIMINDSAGVRTDLAKGLSWDANLDQVVLYPIWLELLIGGARSTTINEPTWLYRRHAGSISTEEGARDEAKRSAVQAKYRALLSR